MVRRTPVEAPRRARGHRVLRALPRVAGRELRDRQALRDRRRPRRGQPRDGPPRPLSRGRTRPVRRQRSERQRAERGVDRRHGHAGRERCRRPRAPHPEGSSARARGSVPATRSTSTRACSPGRRSVHTSRPACSGSSTCSRRAVAEDVLDHLDEYFAPTTRPASCGLGSASPHAVPFGARRRVPVARGGIRRMAGQFIVGASPADAMARVTRSLGRRRRDHRRPPRREDAHRRRGRRVRGARCARWSRHSRRRRPCWSAQPLLDHDPWGSLPRGNVSVKPTALAPLLRSRDRRCRDRRSARAPRPDPRCGAAADVTVHLDTEHDEAKDLTFRAVPRAGRASTPTARSSAASSRPTANDAVRRPPRPGRVVGDDARASRCRSAW